MAARRSSFSIAHADPAVERFEAWARRNLAKGFSLDEAAQLLQATDRSVDRIAEMVGYSDGVTLRTLLRRKLDKGLRELRARAGP